MTTMKFHQLMQFITWAILILHFNYCLSSSIPNQKSDYEVTSGKHIINVLPCFERYVVEPFFEEHNDSCDSCLQEYIVQKIPYGSNDIDPVLLDLERRLIGEGSHRRLSSHIKLSIQPDVESDFSSQICEILLIERLPSGVFADPFELERLLLHGVFKDASVFGDTNLELPSFLSNRSTVEVHLDAAFSRSTNSKIIREFKIEIPLHSRYPPLQEGGYANVKFGVPDIFLRCKNESPVQADSTCLITPVPCNDSLIPQDIVWIVPAGINTHAGMVSVVTFTSAVLSVLFIISASFRRAGSESDSRLKQS